MTDVGGAIAQSIATTGGLSGNPSSGGSSSTRDGSSSSTSSPMRFVQQLDQVNQRFLDKLAPHKLYRWLTLVGMIGIFLVRMYLLEGFYIVTYVLFIFILNQFILFLQPKDRAALAAAQAAANAATGASSGPSLPTEADEEFRPFVRRLPEFKFWHSCTNATIFAFFATFFKFCDVPVFWPVLVFYFIILFIATMRRQWLDMRRLKYVPWDIGSKRKYKSDPRKLTVTNRDAATVALAKHDAVATASARPPPVPVPTVNIKKSAAQTGTPQAR